MTNRRASFAFAALLLALLPAESGMAFEQTVPPASTAQPETLPGIEIKPGSIGHGTGVELTVPGAIGSDVKSKGGLGLGSMGVLPKLDFGLELLYGTPEQPSPDLPSMDSLPDSLTLHGSVKKTF